MVTHFRSRIFFLFLISGFGCALASGQVNRTHSRKKEKAIAMTSARDSLSYALGVTYGQWLKARGLEGLNINFFESAILTQLAGDSSLFNDNTVKMVISEQLQALMNQRSSEAIAAGKKFLEENKTKPGVVSLPDGLQYLVLETGSGPKPGPRDKVTVHYEGKLIDGKIFDSSIQRGKPISFGVDAVIKGWTEALQLMSAGARWRLFIPADLAYGDRQVGQIPANSVLIFDVQLISIQK
jgi:FKBP-type peptidyl-prolyl cis-trans isomerase FklB